MLALSSAAWADRVSLEDPVPITIPANIAQTAAVTAIKQGLGARMWLIKKEEPGRIRATVRANGGVQATIDIQYDAQRIQIKYVASQNLREESSGDQRTISSRYISWSRNLSLSISQALLQQPPSR